MEQKICVMTDTSYSVSQRLRVSARLYHSHGVRARNLKRANKIGYLTFVICSLQLLNSFKVCYMFMYVSRPALEM